MRLFLGIDLPLPVKDELESQMSPLKKEYPQYTWVPKENFHITLHFFGEVNAVDAVSTRIQDLLFDIDPFRLYSLHLDVFVRNKLLLYLAFKREKMLEELVGKIHTDLGISEKFVPHLTLSKSSLSSKQQYFTLKNRLEKNPIHIEFDVSSIYLFSSNLTGRRPVYTKVKEFTLQK